MRRPAFQGSLVLPCFVENKRFYFECPHCSVTVEVPRDWVACTIFRCGAYRTAGLPPIGPHTSRAECERLVREGLIWGCGRPFKFDGLRVSICEYI